MYDTILDALRRGAVAEALAAAREAVAAQPEDAQAHRLLAETSRSIASTQGRMISVNACAALAGALNRPDCKSPKAIALSEKQ